MTCGADADEGRDFRGGRGEFEEQDRGGAAQGEHDDQGESAFRCEHACMHICAACTHALMMMHLLAEAQLAEARHMYRAQRGGELAKSRSGAPLHASRGGSFLDGFNAQRR